MKKANKKKNLNTYRNKKYLYLSFIVLGLVTFGTIGAILLNGSKAAVSGYTLVKTEDFNTFNSTDWTIINNAIYTRSDAIYKDENSYINNGSLVLKTKRHCVNSSISITNSNKTNLENYINDSTTTTAVCPVGKTAYYSSGKVDSDFRWPKGRVEIRAQIPKMQKGYFLGLWLRNAAEWNNGVYDRLYGEIDISEQYGHNVPKSTSTSHIGSANNGSGTYYIQRDKQIDTTQWRTYAVEWDESGIKYYVDDQIVMPANDTNANKTSKDNDLTKDSAKDAGLTQTQFDQLINYVSYDNKNNVKDKEWRTLLEVQVNKSTPPDPNAIFNPMETKIDWIKYYTKDTLPPPPTKKLSAPTNITATSADGKVTLNWSAVANANNYTVRWGQNGVWNYSNSTGPDITGTSYTVSGLANGQNYDFQVGAKDSAGAFENSDFSASVVAVPKNAKKTDFDGNGKVDVNDLVMLLSSWLKQNSIYDVKPDGKVDVNDLSILLSEWG